MEIKTILSGVITPAKLIYAKGMNEKSFEFGISANAGSASMGRLFKVLCMQFAPNQIEEMKKKWAEYEAAHPMKGD